MSMTEEKPEVTFDAPAAKPAKKPAKKKAKARAAAPQPEKSAEPFPGLTRTLCADECYAKKVCAISGSVCAHPCKGGLQSAMMSDPAAMKRLQMASEQIRIRVDPDRFK